MNEISNTPIIISVSIALIAALIAMQIIFAVLGNALSKHVHLPQAPSIHPLKRIFFKGACIGVLISGVFFVAIFFLLIIGGGGDNGVAFRPFITFNKGCFLFSLILFAIAALPNNFFQLLTRK